MRYITSNDMYNMHLSVDILDNTACFNYNQLHGFHDNSSGD